MLPKQHRLTKKKDFTRVFKNGLRPVATGNLSTRALYDQSGYTKVAFIISGKINKYSTKRNSLKRQLRRVVHDLISELKSGYYVVVIVKRDFQYPYNQSEIGCQIKESFKRLGLFK